VKSMIMFILSAMLCLSLAVQSFGQTPADSAAIKQTAMDYVDGSYASDAARVERAVHPDMVKASPRLIDRTGRTAPSYMSYSILIEGTRAKAYAVADTGRHINVQILNIHEDVANVKVTSSGSNEYLQMVKLDSLWKIVNILWNGGPAGANRLKDLKQDTARAAIEQVAMMFLDGITTGDAKRVEVAADGEFSRIAYGPLAVGGTTAVRRQKLESISENTFNRIGKLDEVYRDNQVSVIDVMDGLAVVKTTTLGAYEYLQMYESGTQWKVLNSVSKVRTDITLRQALAATVGQPMPDFTLPIYGGGEFTLSKFKGKNVLLMFPRGWLGTVWCPYCPYQYLELEQMQQQSKIKEAYNLEIAFVMPYSSDRIKDWMEKFPAALQTIESVKHPPANSPLAPYQKDYNAWARAQYPKTFDVKANDPHTVIPVLVDEQRTLSRQLKIFTNLWDGVASEQNIASVFVIDKNGILRFKYISQMTEDRPIVDLVLDVIKNLK
jgi:peroxiredoxin